MRTKHSPNLFSRYQRVHETVIERYARNGFILHNTLNFNEESEGIVLSGTLTCPNGIYIDVEKRLSIVAEDDIDPVVQTISYSYNVALAGDSNIFRYDSPHLSHNMDHHVHRYNIFGDQSETIEMIGQAGWPTLGEVIQEAYEWHQAYQDRL